MKMAASIQANIMNKSINTTIQDVQHHGVIEDLKMEYKMKYERLVKLHQESLESFAAASKSAEIHQNAYENYVKELKNSGFEKDMRIYNLEEQLKNLEAKYTELQCSHNELEAKVLHAESDRNRTVQCSESSKKSANLHGFTVSKKSPVVETPIILSRVPAVDIASPLLLPGTPRRMSKQRRLTIMNETLDKAVPSDEKEKIEFFKDLILEQKESLDFYATMTGFVAWKDKMDESINDSQCSLDFFKMKPQKNGFQGMELQFIVDYNVDDIEYRPLQMPTEIEESLEKTAPFMKDNLYFTSENAPKLLRSLMEVIES